MDCNEITNRIVELQGCHDELSLLLADEKIDELAKAKDKADQLVFEILVKYYATAEFVEERKYKVSIDHRDLIAEHLGYDTVGKFVDGVAFAQKRKKDGQGWEDTSFLIDEYGKTIKAFENVEEILGFGHGVCWLCIYWHDSQGEYQSRYIMIDKTGEIIAKAARIDRENRHNGIFAVSDEKSDAEGESNWYFLKADGNRLNDRNFHRCAGFSGTVNKGWATTSSFSTPIEISADGMERRIGAGTYEQSLRFGPDVSWVKIGNFRYKLYSGSASTFLNDPRTSGEITAELVYPFENGWGGYYQGGKYHFINDQFKKFGIYDQIRPFAVSSDGRFSAAPVRSDGKWYLIDGVQGMRLTEERYEEIGNISDELCWAKIGQDEYCFLGLDGQEPTELKGRRFKSVGPFYDGVASVMDFDGKWHEMDKLGRYVFE